ncbi:hypothetical protein C3B61_03450 [Cryobacterium zongtaii]|uniref:Uncharacterized protein n=1 Tax=Cryobacterium zongtaii TaxID=1259217 RepID=A0A2S3ZKV8_9MICO|nr:hypothetical protein C3B61_03450 [Cryobacterium zongtaii]
MQHRTSTTRTTAETAPTVKVQEWLEARPDVQRLPVTDILKAGFTKPEQAYVVDYLKAQCAKAEAARLTAQTHIIPSFSTTEWVDPEFYLIAETGQHCRAALASPTDPERRQLHGQSVTPTSHPVHSKNKGDKWSFTNEEDETYTYEHLGRYKLVGKFEDSDTEITSYVAREVTN